MINCENGTKERSRVSSCCREEAAAVAAGGQLIIMLVAPSLVSFFYYNEEDSCLFMIDNQVYASIEEDCRMQFTSGNRVMFC